MPDTLLYVQCKWFTFCLPRKIQEASFFAGCLNQRRIGQGKKSGLVEVEGHQTRVYPTFRYRVRGMRCF